MSISFFYMGSRELKPSMTFRKLFFPFLLVMWILGVGSSGDLSRSVCYVIFLTYNDSYCSYSPGMFFLFSASWWFCWMWEGDISPSINWSITTLSKLECSPFIRACGVVLLFFVNYYNFYFNLSSFSFLLRISWLGVPSSCTGSTMSALYGSWGNCCRLV